MGKTTGEPGVKRLNIKEIRAQLDLLTAKIKQYESTGSQCTVSGCKFISDGLRLSQEVELLQRENAALRAEVKTLKARLLGEEADFSAGR
jgi:hypothetical protein